MFDVKSLISKQLTSKLLLQGGVTLSEDEVQMTTDSNESFFLVLSKFIREYRKISFKSIEGYGLTPSEIDVLMFLFNNAPLDTAKDISKYKGISKALVCRSVDSLSKKGLISTVVDKNDRRIIHLTLSDSSSKIVDKLKMSKDIFANNIIEGIKDEDMKIFIKVIDIMLANVNRLSMN